MNIIGFNFSKISGERKNNVLGEININNNITIKEVAEAKIGLAGGDRGAVRLHFAFTSDYAPDLATLSMEGDVIILLENKQMLATLDGWNTSKQLSREFAEPVMNHILERSNIQALLLAKDLNLPSPVPLPKVEVNLSGVKETKKAEPAASPMKPASDKKKK